MKSESSVDNKLHLLSFKVPSGSETFPDPFLPSTCFSLCRRNCHLHFPSSLINWLPIGFDRQKVLAGDWKVGGRISQATSPQPTTAGFSVGAESLSRFQFLWDMAHQGSHLGERSCPCPPSAVSSAHGWLWFLAVTSPSFLHPVPCMKCLLL